MALTVLLGDLANSFRRLDETHFGLFECRDYRGDDLFQGECIPNLERLRDDFEQLDDKR